MDDLGLTPVAPALDNFEDIPEDNESLVETKRQAMPYFHSSWETVEQHYLDEIARNSDLTTIDKSLSPEEFKTEALARIKHVEFLRTQLARVKDAVTALESESRAGGA